jgi:hypothetical protein
MAAAFLLTALAQQGVYWGLGGASPAAQAAGLLAGLLCALLASGAFAAGGGGFFDAWQRAGGVALAHLPLLILMACRDQLSLAGACRLFLLWSALGACVAALVSAFVDPRRRMAAGLAGSVLLVACCATPYWANGLVLSFPSPARDKLASAAIDLNPVFTTLAQLQGRGGFAWSKAPIFYSYSALGQDVPMPQARWAATFAIYLSVAAVLAGAAFAIQRRNRDWGPPKNLRGGAEGARKTQRTQEA